MVFGSLLIDKIYSSLLNDSVISSSFASFLPVSTCCDIKNIVYDIFISAYSHMRGKDFSMKLLSKNSCLKVTTRQVQAVLSNPVHYKKNNNINNR